MVKRVKLLSRQAFTMIELIFAIVIISIAVVSLPMMIQVNNQSIENSMVQEAIFAASAELMDASTGYWDANSLSDIDVSSLSRVIDIGSNCNNTKNSPRYRLRPGHIAQPFHRRCVDGNITDVPVSNLIDNNSPNLNNAVHTSKSIFLNPSPHVSGYKNDYNSSLGIVQTDNIKFIELNVTDTAGNLVTRLRMQSANIGEIDYYKRTF